MGNWENYSVCQGLVQPSGLRAHVPQTYGLNQNNTIPILNKNISFCICLTPLLCWIITI